MTMIYLHMHRQAGTVSDKNDKGTQNRISQAYMIIRIYLVCSKSNTHIFFKQSPLTYHRMLNQSKICDFLADQSVITPITLLIDLYQENSTLYIIWNLMEV